MAFNRDPTYEPTLVELANFYMGGIEDIPAGNDYDFFDVISYIATNTYNASILSQYARVLGSRGQFQEAIAASERAIGYFSFDSHTYLQKAAWESHVGKEEAAKQSRLAAQHLEKSAFDL